ncbi:MAG: flagellar type III secretion system pore protein FliP [Calditrichaeota bacterium]|nr:flagellar type III secretion system pore protein FliP [Calditrichota bacterium]
MKKAGRLILGALLLLLAPAAAFAQAIPHITVGIEPTGEPTQVVGTLQVVALLTLLAFAPALVLMTTSFTRIIVVMHFLRQALGAGQMPPSQLIIGLSLILTFFVMRPCFEQIHDQALKPYLAKEITQKEALDRAVQPLREFMLRQAREQDLALFVRLSGQPRPQNADDIRLGILMPAFLISELRIAFQIGFILYLPFLIIDMVVASVLLAMGMMMLPPIMISLPFKILMFVLVDGWYLVVESLVRSFH